MVGIKEQKFGVEIEMTAITRQFAATVVAAVFTKRSGEVFGIKHDGGTYDTWSVKDDQGRTWKFMSDSSIRAEHPEGRRLYDGEVRTYQTEMVSPPLTYADMDLLQNVVNELVTAGKARVGQQCGMHVHVDAANHTPKSLRNLLILQATKQDMLYRALGVEEERESWCKKIPDFVFEAFKEAKAPTLNSLSKLWYGLLGDGPTSHYDSSRYHGLNFHSVFYRGTVEWRVFNSTLDCDQVTASVMLCLAMSAKAIAATNGFYFDKVDAYADGVDKTMYTWLNGLGLKGEEFKTARQLLTKNLKATA